MNQQLNELFSRLTPLMERLEDAEKAGCPNVTLERYALQGVRTAVQRFMAGDGDEREPGEPEWIQTFSGLPFEFREGSDQQLLLVDIIHSLGNKCRFSGHCHPFYSVAEHSVRVMWLVEQRLGSRMAPHEQRKLLRSALLHDAHEAYTGDVTPPVKALLGPLFGRLVDQVNRSIERVFDVSFSYEYVWIKQADQTLLATERRDLMSPSQRKWKPGAVPLEAPIIAWTPEDAKTAMMAAWKGLAA